jgi:hypothetical protein
MQAKPKLSCTRVCSAKSVSKCVAWFTHSPVCTIDARQVNRCQTRLDPQCVKLGEQLQAANNVRGLSEASSDCQYTAICPA